MTAAGSHVILPQKTWLAGKDTKYRRRDGTHPILAVTAGHAARCSRAPGCLWSYTQIKAAKHLCPAHSLPVASSGDLRFDLLTWLVILTPRGGYLG